MECISPVPQMRVVFLDVGQGDATLIELPGQRFGLVDFGTAAAGRRVVAPRVRALVEAGATFAFAVLTHLDADHAGGLPAVFDVAVPEHLLRPAVNVDLLEQLVRRLGDRDAIDAAERIVSVSSECERHRCSAGFVVPSVIVVPSLRVIGLSPGQHVEDELYECLSSTRAIDKQLLYRLERVRNRASLALYLEFLGATSMILLAEAEGDQYDFIWRVIQRYIGSSYIHPSIVKLSHHGSARNNPPELFRYFGADGVLMPVSAGGQHGHPHVEVMGRARGCGGVVACTNLGAGCAHFIETGMGLPADLAAWRSEFGTPSPPTPQTCYGTMEATAEPHSHQWSIVFEQVQSGCPFGGPKVPLHKLAFR